VHGKGRFVNRAHALPLDVRTLLVAALAVVCSAVAGVAVGSPAIGPGSLQTVGALAGVGVVAATLANARVGLVIVILSLGLPLRTEVAGVTIHLAHVLLAAYSLRAALELLFGHGRLPASLGIPSLVMALGAMVASLAGPRTGGSLFSLVDVVALPLAVGVATAILVDVRRDLPLIATAVAAGLLITSLSAVLQASGFTIGPLAPVEEGRANGLFEHPNVLSGYLAPQITLTMGLAACAPRRVPLGPILLPGALLVGVAALVFTLSRGALLGLAAGIAVMIVLLIARRQVTAVLGVILVIVLTLLVTLPQVPQTQREAFQERFARLFQPGTEVGRQLALIQARQLIADYPLTGVGPLTFGRLSRERSPFGDVEAGREHSHNFFLESYLSFGPVGLLALLWLLGAAAWRYGRASRAGPGSDQLVVGWSIGAVAAFAAVLVQGLGDFVFTNLELFALLLIVAGVAYARGLVESRSAGAHAYASAP
jgi:putative inorganic carbon (hco3(-)) transporter